ncbi:hypothetical protein RhiirB3_428658 [Rhizophagus irregularis]|uniref:Uncharacterized protein n=1 Tax=Rhizophagus irregularis TaxID=588596 RepID=A0A2I1E2J4_9GLOM|nr:hypothetical protein RhiirC2_776571 [Rhizophagus irregularis]PKY16309.1 hypothetical protein RhiirB3_428658 [Rhizophagus irregularis]
MDVSSNQRALLNLKFIATKVNQNQELPENNKEEDEFTTSNEKVGELLKHLPESKYLYALHFLKIHLIKFAPKVLQDLVALVVHSRLVTMMNKV